VSTAFGGVTLLSPGESAWIDFGTTKPAPGTYEVLCFLSAADNRSHAAHGMVHEFTVP
jgi:hypothetical protein